MKYSRRAWFVNRFDVMVAALIGPAVFLAILATKLGSVAQAGIPQGVISGLWIAVLSLLVLNFMMTFVVVHKAWGWLMLPFFVIVRIFATILASLSSLFIIAGMAYQSQAKEKFSKAWVQDERSRNYREGVKDAQTGEGYKSAGSGIWGFLVSHTLEFCER